MTTKQSGLAQALYVDGYDLSGDVGAITGLGSPLSNLDVTGIDKSAFERIAGIKDGSVEFSAFFDPATNRAHPVLSVLPTTDGLVMACTGTAIGAAAACMIAKQTSYDPSRGTDGSMTFKVANTANGFGLEWGQILTAGVRTDTVATTGVSLDCGGGFTTPAVPASTVAATNSSALPATVVITGGTMTNVSINGTTAGTGAGTYTVPAGGTITMTYTVAPTWTWTLVTAFGLQAYLSVFAMTGTDATVKLQDSADGTTFTDIAGAAFTAVTSGRQGQRLPISNTATVRRYVRATTTTSGGFSSFAFAVAFVRNQSAGVVF